MAKKVAPASKRASDGPKSAHKMIKNQQNCIKLFEEEDSIESIAESVQREVFRRPETFV